MFHISRDNAHRCLALMKGEPALKIDLVRLVDAYWDLVEGRSITSADVKLFRRLLTESPSASHSEQAYTALTLIGPKQPELLPLWCEAANNKDWRIRLVAAAFLPRAPFEITRQLLPCLLEDRSKAVRKMAIECCIRWDRAEWMRLLAARKTCEADEALSKRIDLAIELISTVPRVENNRRCKHLESDGRTYEQSSDGHLLATSGRREVSQQPTPPPASPPRTRAR